MTSRAPPPAREAAAASAAGLCSGVLSDIAESPTPDAQVARFQIGEVADRVGLSLRTVRYYEEVGLLTPSGRTPGGFRLYSEDDVARLRILKGMKPFGLSLEEIRDLMALLDASERPGADREAIAAALAGYAQRADDRVAQLQAHTAEVRRLRARIDARLRALDAGGQSAA